MPRKKVIEESPVIESTTRKVDRREIDILLDEYAQSYDLASGTPNDKGNLETMIRNQIYIRKLQTRLDELADDDIAGNIQTIDKLQSGLQRLQDSNLAIERALGIDRKSRNKDNSSSVDGYINDLRIAAREFLDKMCIYVYCPECKVMVARILPVHEHTEFKTQFQCSQCKKFVTADRRERDVFFDLKGDKSWRKKYPLEIVQSKSEEIPEGSEDDIIELSLDEKEE